MGIPPSRSQRSPMPSQQPGSLRDKQPPPAYEPRSFSSSAFASSPASSNNAARIDACFKEKLHLRPREFLFNVAQEAERNSRGKSARADPLGGAGHPGKHSLFGEILQNLAHPRRRSQRAGGPAVRRMLNLAAGEAATRALAARKRFGHAMRRMQCGVGASGAVDRTRAQPPGGFNQLKKEWKKIRRPMERLWKHWRSADRLHYLW